MAMNLVPLWREDRANLPYNGLNKFCPDLRLLLLRAAIFSKKTFAANG
jgi:hypothetical protein